MFSRFGNASQSNDSREVTLTSILKTPALKLEFALLIFVCIDCMRKELVANFELDPSNPTSSQTTSHRNFQASNQHDDAPPPYTPRANDHADTPNLIDFDEPTSPDPPSAGVYPLIAHQSRQQTRSPSNRPLKPYEQWDREQSIARLSHALASPEVQGLRRAALTFFDAWRISILRRVGATLGVLGDTVRKEKLKREARGLYRNRQNGQNSSDGYYKPLPTTLSRLEESQKSVLVQSALLLLLGLENYSAHSKVLLLHLTASLMLPLSLLTEHETYAAKVLVSSASANQAQASTQAQSPNSQASSGFSWKSGLAVVGGAALIGVTGGLAAPLIAAGLGVVAGPAMGALGLGGLASLLGGLIGNSVLVGTIFGVYGGKRMGEVVEKLGGDVEGFELLPLNEPSPRHSVTIAPIGQLPSAGPPEKANEAEQSPPPEPSSDSKLSVTIAISGALMHSSDFSIPWLVVPSTTNLLGLQYEPELRLELGKKINSLIRSAAFSAASTLVLNNTVFATLMAGLYLPLGLLKAASVADSPFNVALSRSDEAGVILANVLMARAQGERPVRLVGWGLGARVLWQACLELSRQNAFGLVEDVVLMGLPGPGVGEERQETGSEVEWRRVRSVVAGRVVNCYGKNDWLLKFLYRLRAGLGAVAGLEEVFVHGVENVDVNDLLSGAGYAACTGKVLERAGWELNEEELQRQETARRQARENEQINERRRNGDVQSGLEGVVNESGKVEMVEEGSGKIVMLDLETGAVDEKTELPHQGGLAERLDALKIDKRGRNMQQDPNHVSEPIPLPQDNHNGMNSHQTPLQSSSTRAPHEPLENHVEDESEDDADDSGMAYLAPEPEPDPENVTFGAPGGGINMVWQDH